MNGILALKPLATPAIPEPEFVANTGQIWQFLNQNHLALLLGLLPKAKNKNINMKNSWKILAQELHEIFEEFDDQEEYLDGDDEQDQVNESAFKLCECHEDDDPEFKEVKIEAVKTLDHDEDEGQVNDEEFFEHPAAREAKVLEVANV